MANSFATSVGSRSLKLWQAVCIAALTEFSGAVLLGASTTGTVKDGIIATSTFNARPDLLMSGFMSALMASSSWVMFATCMGWPVSTTHSIIGALIGVGVSAAGLGAVNWGWEGKGVAQVVTSWFLSPVLAGVLAAGIYLVTKHAVLRRSHSLARGIWAIPLYFTVTTSSVNGHVSIAGDTRLCFGIMGGITAAMLVFCAGFMVPYFHRRLVSIRTSMSEHPSRV